MVVKSLDSLLSKHSLCPGTEPVLTQTDAPCCYKDGLWQAPSSGLPAPYFFPWNTNQELLQLSQKCNIYISIQFFFQNAIWSLFFQYFEFEAAFYNQTH